MNNVMHEFDNLIYRSTFFTLNALNELDKEAKKQFPTGSSKINVENLQMIQLRKSILAIGMFSLFESILQNRLKCSNGFKKVKIILRKNGKFSLLDKFNDFYCAINVLKHGKGNSYDSLIKKQKILPFKIKQPGERFFSEGDVSEVSTLIKVDNKFILDCAELIKQIAKDVKNHGS